MIYQFFAFIRVNLLLKTKNQFKEMEAGRYLNSN